MANGPNERSPLLQNGHADSQQDEPEIIDFSKEDGENPRNWPRRRKFVNVAIIAFMAILSPLASSMFTPGISEIAKDLNTSDSIVVGATTGFVVFLGIGPLILAPFSETFGRRKLYLVCFSIFALLQIPTALSPNVGSLIGVRTISGFFGSVGIANGGGTISDMFHPSERAGVFGWYLLGPLLGLTLGPLFGGIIVQNLGWRWIFWILTIVCSFNTIVGFFFLIESYPPAILEARKKTYEDLSENCHKTYRIAGQDDRPFWTKLAISMARPLRILFTQPIVLTMAVYQAILFGTTYSLYTNFEAIYGELYGFDTTTVGLMYLGPGIGFLIAVWFIVPKIDTIYNYLARKNNVKAKPEYRLPLANIGAVFIPTSLFVFAWTVQYKVHFVVPLISSAFFGLGQIAILNTCQNYYIDSFEKYAASAIAAGAVFRSIVGGILPIGASQLFQSVGYGWGISVFAFLSLALSPAPLLFFYFGEGVRERFAIEL
ncbi:MAG: hypothetical protein ALECFALPRED_008561 [Alectoria fallacina]|uniref:Major facilitator superfamily (MFS) profile domain-containing protein n=1 Tax=Alectoria fallacina TaxID=1903189 RepID=A0A8H3EH27_9LECA|nr:MAG: hypothetical protein ALECFALPRED_008561 [Alectoria fallacina]